MERGLSGGYLTFWLECNLRRSVSFGRISSYAPHYPNLPKQPHLPMSRLLETASRLANSGLAQVTIKNRSRGLIVPPGVQGNKITIRVLDAAGKPSGPVKFVSVKDVQLEDLPAPPREAFMLGAACVGCGNAADRFKCPG